ncbi:hypothetical protein M758_9G074400 [Ceratodon purpureus]|nr:hypothetical protein M758_9G074400 [Ceratodon purpureus]
MRCLDFCILISKVSSNGAIMVWNLVFCFGPNSDSLPRMHVGKEVMELQR